MVRGALLTANLPQLQNLIKRDPAAYREEFLQQWNHYNSARHLFKLNPDDQAGNFKELVTFISQVASCYPTETADFPSQLFSLLTDNYPSLSQEIKKSLLQNLVMLRKKEVISSIDLLKYLFPLLPRTSSASLRLFIRHTILSDIVSANARHKNHRLNRAMQAMLFNMIERGMEYRVTRDMDKSSSDRTADSNSEAMWAVIVAKELWKKSVWTDSKTVAIIALGCTHPNLKVQSASMHFFIGEESDEGADDTEADTGIDVRALHHRREINKKTKSGEKKFHKQLKSARKKARPKTSAKQANFPALELLRDPQSFADKVFNLLNHHDTRFTLDHKILVMQLLSRVMSVHKVCILNFYSYAMKFLHYRQPRIPSILVALAQSVNDMTPPDAIEPVIRKLAQEFVHPGVSSEVIAAGLNSIREISARQPWAMDSSLLEDLIEYRKSKDKGVITAARGLLQLYREINPSMLKKRERGKEASMSVSRAPLPFGQSNKVAVDIEGLTLLEDHFNKLHEEEGAANDTEWDGWTVNSDSSSASDSEGWINVEDEEGDIAISGSDDDLEPTDPQAEATASSRVSTLATTKILTPADFALLNDLRIQAATRTVQMSGGSASKRKLASLEANRSHTESNLLDKNVFVTEEHILGKRKKAKADYAERLASIQSGREGRAKFGSRRGKDKEVPSSSTNREKVKNKPIMMILSSDTVRRKKKASLRDKQRKLRAHVEKMKKGAH
ncbi:hypothetical protein M378DRAFT_120982 [Amanita muscaria Koide BX008]|uniref:Protein SDA1 n=1 Tax=Amanita muscaria (strain Koide BX008) TaxID=946122 RepID=A0A0C2SYQ4_AMAMK|nr:hypothetical protein M378DRAFT_120982 [Amanita muscaria Koide BX008]